MALDIVNNITHCTICWNDLLSYDATIYITSVDFDILSKSTISGVLTSLSSHSASSGIQSAGNQKQVRFHEPFSDQQSWSARSFRSFFFRSLSSLFLNHRLRRSWKKIENRKWCRGTIHEPHDQQSWSSKRNVSSLVGTSETTRATPFSLQFCQWLAGLIDGDGSLQVSKAGYTSCEIIMGSADEACVRYLQNKLGGSLKPRSGANALRWRLHNKQGMIKLVNCINGHIRHTARLAQLHRVCTQLNLAVIAPNPIMDRSNAWFAGFFDAEGTITLNTSGTAPQLTLSVTNKVQVDVQWFKDVFGYNVYYDTARNGYYKWTVQNRAGLIDMIDYFKLCPLRSAKNKILQMIPQFYPLKNLRAYKPGSVFHKIWQQFVTNWKAKI